jgi:hypothetical protein
MKSTRLDLPVSMEEAMTMPHIVQVRPSVLERRWRLQLLTLPLHLRL